MAVESNKYIQYWDEAIRQWADSPVPAFMESEKHWLEPSVARRGNSCVAEAIGLQPELLPNPYWGNPERCSAVILNYNPGGSDLQGEALKDDHCHHCHVNDDNPGLMASAIARDYSAAALHVPDFSKPRADYWTRSEGTAFRHWMKQRSEWVKRMLPESTLPPFFLEICGWHSKRWNCHRLPPKVMDELCRRVGPVLEESILNSEARVGFAIGASFGKKGNILNLFGYEDITQQLTGGETIQPLPEVSRWYKVFVKPDSGAPIIVTWSAGSNRQPSAIFADAERAIIAMLREWLSKS